MNKKSKQTLAGLTAFLTAFSATVIPQVADNIGISVVAAAADTAGTDAGADAVTSDTNASGNVSITTDGNTTYYADLASAVGAAADGSTITLNADIDCNTRIEITDKNLTIDLNGKTLTNSSIDSGLTVIVVSGGTVEIKNGTVKSVYRPFWAENKATLKLTDLTANVTCSSISENLEVVVADDATLKINGCEFTDDYYNAVLVRNGSASAEIVDSTIHAEPNDYFAAIMGTGNIAYQPQNATITLRNTTVTSTKGYGIYQPNQGKIVLEGTTSINAPCGISLKSGSLEIKDEAEVVGTADRQPNLYYLNGGVSDGTKEVVDGCAIVLDSNSNKGYTGEINVTINGGTIKSNYSSAIRTITEKGATTGFGKIKSIEINGGTITSASGIAALELGDKDTKTIRINGGTFSSDPSKIEGVTIPEGMGVKKDGDNYTISTKLDLILPTVLPESAEIEVKRGEETLDASKAIFEGDVLTVTVTAPEGKVVKKLTTEDGEEVTENADGSYNITVGTNNISISVEFADVFKVDLAGLANIELYKGDVEVDADTTFEKGDKLTIKAADGYKITGEVKVGETVVTADKNGEYVYEFTGKEDSSNDITITANAEVIKYAVTFDSTKVAVKVNGDSVESGAELASGTELIITPVLGETDKVNRVIVNGEVINYSDSYTVGNKPVVIVAEIAKVESIEVVGGKDKYFSTTTVDDVKKDYEVNVLYDDGSASYHLKIDQYVSNFVIKDGKLSFDVTYGGITQTVEAPVVDVAVEKIAVTTEFKKDYKVGDELNLTDGKITVYNNDGTSEEKEITADMVSGFDSTTANSNLKLTITYTDENGVSHTTDYYVVVIDSTKTVSGIEISDTPTTTEYFVGDELVVGGKIKVTYDGEDVEPETIEITEGMISGFDSSNAGTKTITVTYGGATATYDVNVKEIALESIVITAPTKKDYMIGESLDLTGGSLKATYNNGTIEEVPLTAAGVAISGFDSSKTSLQTITVTYGGETATFDVTVNSREYKVTFSDATVKKDDTEITSGATVAENTKLTITAVEKSGYTVKSIVVNGKEYSGSTATATIINNTTITVKYTKNSSSGGSSSGGGSYGGGGSSSGGSSSSTPKNPTVDGKEMTWNDVTTEINKLTEGKEKTISLNGTKEIPADVVKAIANSKAVVTIVVNDVFSWTIDGSELDAKNAKALDLTVNSASVTGTNVLRGIVGTRFALNGTNGKTELNVNFKSTHAGKFANLFKKVGDKLVFVDNVKLDKDGKAIGLEVSEKGDYVIMLGEYSDRLGDMDNDGILNAKDALAVLRDFASIEAGKNPLVADINGDGFRNAYDALMILKMAAGIL